MIDLFQLMQQHRILRIYNSQVSGKQLKLIDNDDESIILKGYISEQVRFYSYIKQLTYLNPEIQLKPYLPKYFGQIQLLLPPQILHSFEQYSQNLLKTWLLHLKDRYRIRNISNKFIKMQNLTYKYAKPNIIDIKIGQSCSNKTHRTAIINNGYNLKLNGCTINFPESKQSIFLTKYFLKEVVEPDQILLYLSMYFYDGKNILLSVLNNMINQLKQIYLALKLIQGCCMHSTSIYLLYDVLNPKQHQVKLIDFGRVSFYTENSFKNAKTCHGVSSLIQLLLEIYNSNQKFEIQLPNKIQELLSSKLSLTSCIPQKKISKYRMNSIDKLYQ